MTTEDQIRRILHPEAHERLSASKPMPFDPVRPIGRGQPPLGCDQQGRHPQAAEPGADLDELGVRLPEPDPWWHDWLLVAVALLVLGLVFAPLGR
jgi:hypothetical protein